VTYTLTTEHEIEGVTITAEWSYSVEPGYRGSLVEQPYPATPYDMSVKVTMDGKPLDPPDWLWAEAPSDDDLIENANESLEQAACDAAEYRQELREDAA
jgi:hypothetical protein